MLEKPEAWGAQELSSKEVTMRLVAKTAPMRQWEVARELRARIKSVLDAAGVAPADPDTIVITAPPDPAVKPPAALPAAAEETAAEPAADPNPRDESLAEDEALPRNEALAEDDEGAWSRTP